MLDREIIAVGTGLCYFEPVKSVVKILLAHNRYQISGGEDTVFAVEKATTEPNTGLGSQLGNEDIVAQ